MKQAHLFESNLMNLENKGELLKSMKLIEAHERVVYSSIQDRKKIQWPNGARVALCIVPNVEHYEYLPPAHPIRNAYPRTPHPDVFSYGAKDYGNRSGLWRMLDVLDHFNIRATASLNIGVIEHYPEVFQAMEDRHWDYIGHGMYNTRYMWGVSEEEELHHIQACVDLYRQRTGRQLMGWLSPALSHTLLTPDLVAQAGIRYLCDWVHDDQPWPMRVREGKLITMPYSVDLNDAVTHRQGYESEEFSRMVIDTFDTLWREGELSGRVMSIAVHPYNMGQPHRIGHFEKALAHIMKHDHVWIATGTEICECYEQHICGDVC